MKKNIVLFSLISFSAILIDPFVNVKPVYSHSGYSRFNCKDIAGSSAACFERKGKWKHSNCVTKGLNRYGHYHDSGTRKGEKKRCK